MTELSRTLMRSWPRTISQQVVPADAGTHNGLRSEKRPLLKCRSESPRRMGPCVRRDDSLENSICDSLAPTRGESPLRIAEAVEPNEKGLSHLHRARGGAVAPDQIG